MVEFNIPDYAIDLTTITEAAKRNGIIVVPSNCSKEVIWCLKGLINERGYTHPDGTVIPVITWCEYSENIDKYSKYDPVFYLYKDIFAEVFNYHWMDAVVLVDRNDN